MKVSVSNLTPFARFLDLDGDSKNTDTTVPIGPKASRVKVNISNSKTLNALKEKYKGVLTFRTL